MLKLKLQYSGHLNAKSWFIRKDHDAGKDWRQEEKGTTENEMVGWHHWLNGHEFEQAQGVGDEQGVLVCCSPGAARSRTWLSNWTEKNICENNPSVQFSRSVVSDSSWPHESQHARPPCPSPRVHSDSRPSRQWCHPALSLKFVKRQWIKPLHCFVFPLKLPDCLLASWWAVETTWGQLHLQKLCPSLNPASFIFSLRPAA